MMLELQDVTKTYRQGGTIKDALKKVNLKINDDSSNIIIGPAGYGKSTLINLLSLMLKPTSGKLIFKDMDTSNLTEEDRTLLRREEIGIIYQRDNLFPFLNLVENVSVPQLSRDPEISANLLEEMGFKYINKCPQELSTLDQQKVALARALINEPSILLMDEPTGELNKKETRDYMELLMEFGKDCAVLMVTDNPSLGDYFHQVLFLDDGIIH